MKTPALLLSVILCLPGCSASSDRVGGAGDGDGPDAGAQDAGLFPGEGEGEGGPQCARLVAATCGETCQESPACAAATLLAQYDPGRCAAALEDTQTFPHCGQGNCETLTNKVCGASGACRDAPGCTTAEVLLQRERSPDATQQQVEEASTACRQALEDEVVFAPCG